MKHPTLALFIIDNWDGEGDRYWIFRYQKDGIDQDSLVKNDKLEILRGV